MQVHVCRQVKDRNPTPEICPGMLIAGHMICVLHGMHAAHGPATVHVYACTWTPQELPSQSQESARTARRLETGSTLAPMELEGSLGGRPWREVLEGGSGPRS